MCVFEKSVKVLYMLIALVKSFDQRSVLGTALKVPSTFHVPIQPY